MKEKKNGRQFLQSREFRIGVMSCLVVALLCSTAFAAEGDTTTATLVTAFQTGFQQIASDATNLIAVAAPIALGLAGTIFLARKAISWFKGMAK